MFDDTITGKRALECRPNYEDLATKSKKRLDIITNLQFYLEKAVMAGILAPCNREEKRMLYAIIGWLPMEAKREEQRLDGYLKELEKESQ